MPSFSSPLRLVALALLALGAAMPGFAQARAAKDPKAALASLQSRLPADWYAEVSRYQALLDPVRIDSAKDDLLRWSVLDALKSIPGAEDFVLDHAFGSDVTGSPRHGIPSRAFLCYGFWGNGHWANHPRLLAVLEKAAGAESDPKVSAVMVETIHTIMANRVRNLNRERVDTISWMAEQNKAYQATIDDLQAENEDLGYIIDDVPLPEFLRKAPPVFTVKTSSPSIRVVAMGDFGTNGKDENLVAEQMVAHAKAKPYDFGITLGDNFYFEMTSPEDPKWDSVWQKLYGPIGVTFYPCFGNHDWGGSLPATELIYSYRSANWHFPAPSYTYVAGPVQFFVINPEYGNDGHPYVPDGQVAWLKRELEKSTAAWKIVYGHFPLYQSTWNDDGLIKTLMPVLKGRADAYLCGHVHNLQHHKPVDGVAFFVIGASGRGGVPVDEKDPGTVWAKTAYGFAELEADAHAFTVRFIGEDGAMLHEATMTK